MTGAMRPRLLHCNFERNTSKKKILFRSGNLTKCNKPKTYRHRSLGKRELGMDLRGKSIREREVGRKWEARGREGVSKTSY